MIANGIRLIFDVVRQRTQRNKTGRKIKMGGKTDLERMRGGERRINGENVCVVISTEKKLLYIYIFYFILEKRKK